jgi:hypothetical protein
LLWKNCVKLPSADAESEIPGDEKPFPRDGTAAGGAGRTGLSPLLDGALLAAFEPETKIRVNSPGAWSGCAGEGALTTAVGLSTDALGSLGGAGFWRGPGELNN